MKIYAYRVFEHRFNDDGSYLGFFDENGTKLAVGFPFTEWEFWDEGKDAFLKSMGFVYQGNKK